MFILLMDDTSWCSERECSVTFKPSSRLSTGGGDGGGGGGGGGDSDGNDDDGGEFIRLPASPRLERYRLSMTGYSTISSVWEWMATARISSLAYFCFSTGSCSRWYWACV